MSHLHTMEFVWLHVSSAGDLYLLKCSFFFFFPLDTVFFTCTSSHLTVFTFSAAYILISFVVYNKLWELWKHFSLVIASVLPLLFLPLSEFVPTHLKCCFILVANGFCTHLYTSYTIKILPVKFKGRAEDINVLDCFRRSSILWILN